MKQTKENTVFLILKKEYYDAILSGTKKKEYRDFTDYYIKRFCKLSKDGSIENMKSLYFVKFQQGYSKERQMLVEIKDLYLEFEYDKNEEIDGENSQFIIELGKIIETVG